MPPSETNQLELKSSYDPAQRRDQLGLVREIVAMANAEGGEVHLGVEESGERPGLDQASVALLDPARVQDLIDSFIEPDHIRLECRTEAADEADRRVVIIRVSPVTQFPLVFTKPGDFEENGESQKVFARHAVYRRRGTKAEPARREDFREWIERAVERENEAWKSRVAVLARLPAGASLEVVTGSEEALDEPAALLRHQTRLFNRRQDALLSKHDLVMIFMARDQLVLRRDEAALLLHSSFRRRPTLYFWLDLIDPSPATIGIILDEVLAASDRDKSDAARSVVEVSALFLGDEAFIAVIERLAESEYKHFREHASDAPDRGTVLDRLASDRDSNLDGIPISEWPDTDLAALTDVLARPMLSAATYDGPSRKLARVGVELYLRHRRPDLLA
jgi:hypothetical protein